MIGARLLLLVYCFILCSADDYVKPDYPKQPLSKDENQNLLRTCGRQLTGKLQQKVWNPEFINRTDAPWAVAVLSSSRWQPGMKVAELYKYPGAVCSGTLISPRHVFTAAHCIAKNILRTIFVIDEHCSVNSPKCRGKPIYLRTAARVFASVRYDELNPTHNEFKGADVAVFELTEDVPFSENVWPACLGDTAIQVGQILDLYGFGSNAVKNDSWALQHAVIDAVNCKSPLSSDHFCSYMPYQKPCGGDSGAGLIETDSHERKFVVATHTAGHSCENANTNTVFGPSTSIEKIHTLIKPHLYWICEATGVCVNDKIVKDVEKWGNLPNRHRERYVTHEPLEEDKIYV